MRLVAIQYPPSQEANIYKSQPSNSYLNSHQAQDESDDEDSSLSSPGAPATQSSQRRRISPSPDGEGYDDENDMSRIDGSQSYSSHHAMVKKLVRLALASEYSRQVIRRNDISQKVLGVQGARQFKQVFAEAQSALKETFGMQMIEQPMKEKLSIGQRRGEHSITPLRLLDWTGVVYTSCMKI